MDFDTPAVYSAVGMGGGEQGEDWGDEQEVGSEGASRRWGDRRGRAGGGSPARGGHEGSTGAAVKGRDRVLTQGCSLTCSPWFQLVMASLYHVYEALEEEIEHNRENPVYAPLYFPEELHRKAALERDMAFWYGPRWHEAIPYTQATRRYVQRLQEVGRREPELLVAHAYTRYLGDLSGGQVLKKIAQKALDLPSSGEGVDFFTFPNIASATKFKQLYRSRMNSLEMTPEVRQRVIEEAKTAFLLNIQVRGCQLCPPAPASGCSVGG